jgi:hypothetical protein
MWEARKEGRKNNGKQGGSEKEGKEGRKWQEREEVVLRKIGLISFQSKIPTTFNIPPS